MQSVTAAIALYRKISKGDVVLDPEWIHAGLEQEAPVLTTFRPLAPGMGQAVAERTVLRKKDNGEWENWGDPETYRRTCGDGNGEKTITPGEKRSWGPRPGKYAYVPS